MRYIFPVQDTTSAALVGRIPLALDADGLYGDHSRWIRKPDIKKAVAPKYSDVMLRLIEDHGDEFGPLTPEKEKNLRQKLYIYVLLLVTIVNLLLFVSLAPNIQHALSNIIR
jgi:hypothetical protein